ncbi:MAG TPA: hypothetical protein VFS59_03740 [Gemmatimonadaceae bacterium]|nr:hypothetical protein [Gemmatimonadaceae bacterium]
MKSSSSLRLGVLLALAGASACGDVPAPTTALVPSSPAEARVATATTDENIVVSPLLSQINASLEAAGADYRVVRGDLRIAADGWEAVTSTVLIADDRYRGIGAEWVKGDPRRGGRGGVTYAFGSNTAIAPTTRDPNGANVRLVPAADQSAAVDEGMQAWAGIGCSAQPITRVAIPAGTDPDLLDQLVRGQAPSQNYARPADIVHSGWQPASWFRTLAGGTSGNNILGVTLLFAFTNAQGAYTDIDRNGKADLRFTELFYNARFYWGNGAPNVVDTYSIIAHESGHAVGVGHFGRVFVTKSDAADGISISDVKYAPYALMNAVYVTGRSAFTGTDLSSFCSIWSSF